MNTPAVTQRSAFGLRRIIARYPLTAFFLLAYAFSWWTVPFGGQLPHGPLLAAVVVLAVTEGRPGLRGLWRQFIHWRVKWYWYFIAPGIVLTYQAVALAINLMMGATLEGAAELGSGNLLLVMLPLLLLGGQWEEPGWAGYALPRVQARYAHLAYGPVVASLIVGVLRGVWHLPLFISGMIPWYDVLFLSLAMQFIITWLYNRTQGSLPIVMLFHFASNVAGATVPQLYAGDGWSAHSMLFVALAFLAALLIVGLDGPSMGKRPLEGGSAA